MNIEQLLNYLFGDEVPSVLVFEDEAVIEISDFDTASEQITELQNPSIDLCSNGQCFAVVSDTLDQTAASFIMTNGEKSIGVFMIECVDEEDSRIPEEWLTEIPAPLHGWEYSETTNVVYELDDVLKFLKPETGKNDDVPENGSEVEMLLDAEILGESDPEGDALLDQNFVFMVGDLYGQRDRRNTQDGKWKRVEAPLYQWLGNPKWGLARHPESKSKEGSSVVLAESIDGKRNDAAIDTMYAIGIDIDSGAALDDVIDKLIELKILSFVYTSFSHGKDTLVLKHDEIMRKMKLDDTPTRPQIQDYLREHHKDRFDTDFIKNIEVVEARKQTSDGMRTILKTPALDKFRVILPLQEPVKLSDLAPTVNGWKEVWADAVCGAAVNLLDVAFDSTSCDVNRLFYTPRHPKGDDNWYSAIIRGKPLKFEDIKPYSKDKFVKKREPGDPFTAGTGDDVGVYNTPSGMNLNDWHRVAKTRFMAADVIETYAQDRIRIAGGEKVGTVHVECPFEDGHTTPGGTATMAMNATDSDSEYWTIFCRHDSCQGRHKLEFLQEMIEQDWFPETVLKDESFVLPPADGEEDEQEEEATKPERSALQEAEALNENSSEEDIKKFVKRHFRLGADKTEQAAITRVLSERTELTKRDINRMWKELEREREAKRIEAAAQDLDNFDGFPVVNLWDFKKMVEWGNHRIQTHNAQNPRLFHYMDGVARLRQNASGNWGIHLLTKEEFAAELNRITTWNHQTILGEQTRTRGVSAPDDVVKNMFWDIDAVYPPLRAVVTSPIFTKEGVMITEPGYDESGIYYQPDGFLDIPNVSDVPTADEVNEASMMLVEEALADFPFGGLTRDDIMYECFDEEGQGVPAITHCLAMLLLFFCRDMIEGPTPGHLLGKPAPGTGASLLTDTCSIIATGEVTPATAMPTSPEEMSKTITTLIADGSNMIFFDNINQGVDSGELASAMTAPKYKARILGKTQSVSAEVRCVWTLTGNNVQLSSEILRRCVLIDLDAQSAEPEKRSGWRHGDIRGWVRQNRGKLVWACLTLIQNWIAQGQKPYKEQTLNSYENWSSVLGGIFRDAGIKGFLGNRQELKSLASDGKENDIFLLLEDWWRDFLDKWMPTRESDDSDSVISMALRNDVQINVRKAQNADGETTYNAGQFDVFLTKYQNRVFRLSDGTEVRLEKHAQMDRSGQKWRLKSMTNAPESNVDV